MSVLQLYLFLESTSGLIQKGLPIRVSLSARVCISSADTPKSDNLISPNSLIRMFPALISRWIVLRWCKYSNPRSVGCRIEAITFDHNADLVLYTLIAFFTLGRQDLDSTHPPVLSVYRFVDFTVRARSQYTNQIELFG
jgi:hypothetical protein